jgi:hypothetical protein
MRQIEFLCWLLYVLASLAIYSEIATPKPIILTAAVINIAFYVVTGIGLTRRTFVLTAWKITPPEDRAPLLLKTVSGLIFAFCIFTLYSNERFIYSFDKLCILAVALTTVLMFFSMLLLEKNHSALNRSIVVRSSIFSTIIALYFVVPLSWRLSLRFDDVYYRELLAFSIENPDDHEAKQELLEYEARMEGVELPETP